MQCSLFIEQFISLNTWAYFVIIACVYLHIISLLYMADLSIYFLIRPATYFNTIIGFIICPFYVYIYFDVYRPTLACIAPSLKMSLSSSPPTDTATDSMTVSLLSMPFPGPSLAVTRVFRSAL